MWLEKEVKSYCSQNYVFSRLLLTPEIKTATHNQKKQEC